MQEHNPKTYSLDDFIEEEFGAKGTVAREHFDAMVAEKVEKADAEVKASYHITMSKELHQAISQKAKQLGQSVSTFVNSIMMKELELAR